LETYRKIPKFKNYQLATINYYKWYSVLLVLIGIIIDIIIGVIIDIIIGIIIGTIIGIISSIIIVIIGNINEQKIENYQ